METLTLKRLDSRFKKTDISKWEFITPLGEEERIYKLYFRTKPGASVYVIENYDFGILHPSPKEYWAEVKERYSPDEHFHGNAKELFEFNPMPHDFLWQIRMVLDYVIIRLAYSDVKVGPPKPRP